MIPDDPLVRALTVLAELLAEGKPVRIQVERDKSVAELRVVVPRAIPSSNDSHNYAGREFSPIETAVMKVVTTSWQTAAQIAEQVQQSRSSWFCAILSNLVDREYLQGGRNGYRLPPAE